MATKKPKTSKSPKSAKAPKPGGALPGVKKKRNEAAPKMAGYRSK